MSQVGVIRHSLTCDEMEGTRHLYLVVYLYVDNHARYTYVYARDVRELSRTQIVEWIDYSCAIHFSSTGSTVL
jgi:hypothetical protein